MTYFGDIYEDNFSQSLCCGLSFMILRQDGGILGSSGATKIIANGTTMFDGTAEKVSSSANNHSCFYYPDSNRRYTYLVADEEEMFFYYCDDFSKSPKTAWQGKVDYGRLSYGGGYYTFIDPLSATGYPNQLLFHKGEINETFPYNSAASSGTGNGCLIYRYNPHSTSYSWDGVARGSVVGNYVSNSISYDYGQIASLYFFREVSLSPPPLPQNPSPVYATHQGFAAVRDGSSYLGYWNGSGGTSIPWGANSRYAGGQILVVSSYVNDVIYFQGQSFPTQSRYNLNGVVGASSAGNYLYLNNNPDRTRGDLYRNARLVYQYNRNTINTTLTFSDDDTLVMQYSSDKNAAWAHIYGDRVVYEGEAKFLGLGNKAVAILDGNHLRIFNAGETIYDRQHDDVSAIPCYDGRLFVHADGEVFVHDNEWGLLRFSLNSIGLDA